MRGFEQPSNADHLAEQSADKRVDMDLAEVRKSLGGEKAIAEMQAAGREAERQARQQAAEAALNDIPANEGVDMPLENVRAAIGEKPKTGKKRWWQFWK